MHHTLTQAEHSVDEREGVACRQQVASVLLSLEDELVVLDLRYADLLQSVQTLGGSDEEDVEVKLLSRH